MKKYIKSSMKTTRCRATLCPLFLIAVVMTTQVALYFSLSRVPVSSRTTSSLPCKVQRVGSFGGNSSVLIQPVSYGVMRDSHQCIEECYKRKFRLASYDVTDMCLCGHSLLSTAHERVTHLKRAEKISFIFNNCDKADLTKYKFVGCFFASSRIHVSIYTSDVIMCLITCENKGFPLASLSRGSECFCIRINAEFLSLKRTDDAKCSGGLARHHAVWRTWVYEPQCGAKSFSSVNRPRVGLVSFPGSGNTWLRQMIEATSGVYTGSMYNEKELFIQGFLGEFSPLNKTVAVKDHLYLDKIQSLQKYKKIILLVRNPFDSLVAEFNRRNSNNHIGRALPEAFANRDWSKYVIPLLDQWKSSALRVARSGIPLLVVYFEDLMKNSIEKQIVKILEFAGFHLQSFESRLVCLLTEDFELFRRTPANSSSRIYSSGLTALVNKAIVEVRKELETKNCEGCREFPKNYEREPRDKVAVIDTSKGEGVSVIETKNVKAKM